MAEEWFEPHGWGQRERLDYRQSDFEQCSPSLLPAEWIPVSDTPIQIGDAYLVPIEMSGSICFYCLRLSSQ